MEKGVKTEGGKPNVEVSREEKSTSEETDDTSETESQEVSPKQYTSIFEKIIPDFNYFNFFK